MLIELDESLVKAMAFVNHLPYGRNSDRANYRLVLTEGKGTCSTKHAFIAALAEEQHIPLLLCMGLFEMNAQNTPAISSILEKYKLRAILEAHCYLRHKNQYERRVSQHWRLDRAKRNPDYRCSKIPIKPSFFSISISWDSIILNARYSDDLFCHTTSVKKDYSDQILNWAPGSIFFISNVGCIFYSFIGR